MPMTITVVTLPPIRASSIKMVYDTMNPYGTRGGDQLRYTEVAFTMDAWRLVGGSAGTKMEAKMSEKQ